VGFLVVRVGFFAGFVGGWEEGGSVEVEVEVGGENEERF
jgi:hypothetical protein